MVTIAENIISEVHEQYQDGLNMISDRSHIDRITFAYNPYNSVKVTISENIYDEVIAELDKLIGERMLCIEIDRDTRDSYRVEKIISFVRRLIKYRDMESDEEVMRKLNDIPEWNDEF